MNFFEQQDRARGQTRRLVLLFSAAIIALILITALLVVLVLGLAERGPDAPLLPPGLFSSELFLGIALAVVAVVLLGAMYRSAQLRGGGRVVAESLGGRLLNVQTRDADERKILNVVEEMAIAAGLPVPPVYLLEDPAINAFAAGYRQQDAVIGITRGCIEKLDREELQGVIAHEFSHIFNGDMRLNIRLMGWLYGIMVIGMIGYFLMRGSTYRHMRGSSRGKNGGGIVLLGLGLMVVGYGGTFFGNLIKAAVSRQREFLADASAVQFTRNPSGIGNALKKIGGLDAGSRITSTDTTEISHMLFSQGLARGLTGLFATHPPLAERIRRIEPRWDGKFLTASAGPRAAAAAGSSRVSTSGGTAALSPLLAAAVVDRVGQIDPAALAVASRQLASLSPRLREECHNSLGASLLVQAMLVVVSEPASARQQLALLGERLPPASFKLLGEIGQELRELPRTQYLPLLELALPSLAQLSAPQYRVFMATLHAMMQVDGKVSLFEWCLYRILRHSLDPRGGDGSHGPDRLESHAESCRSLLSALAWAGQGEQQAATTAFVAGMEYLQLEPGDLQAGPAIDLATLDAALEQLRKLHPLQKPRLLKGMVACISQDGVLRASEGELLRAVAAVLDCPMPPLDQVKDY